MERDYRSGFIAMSILFILHDYILRVSLLPLLCLSCVGTQNMYCCQLTLETPFEFVTSAKVQPSAVATTSSPLPSTGILSFFRTTIQSLTPFAICCFVAINTILWDSASKVGFHPFLKLIHLRR